jgi:hypothetical protein
MSASKDFLRELKMFTNDDNAKLSPERRKYLVNVAHKVYKSKEFPMVFKSQGHPEKWDDLTLFNYFGDYEDSKEKKAAFLRGFVKRAFDLAQLKNKATNFVGKVKSGLGDKHFVPKTDAQGRTVLDGFISSDGESSHKSVFTHPEYNTNYPPNSVLIQAHGMGGPGKFTLRSNRDSLGVNEMTLPKLTNYLGADKTKAVRDAYISACNSQGGLTGPEALKHFPSLTNLVTTAPNTMGIAASTLPPSDEPYEYSLEQQVVQDINRAVNKMRSLPDNDLVKGIIAGANRVPAAATGAPVGPLHQYTRPDANSTNWVDHGPYYVNQMRVPDPKLDPKAEHPWEDVKDVLMNKLRSRFGY